MKLEIAPPPVQWAVPFETRTAYNRFVRVAGVLTRTKMPRRPPAGLNPANARVQNYVRAKRADAAGDFVVKESRESELVREIEHALATGKPLEGFLSMTHSVTGGVRVVPLVGKAFTTSSVHTLAKMIDLNMVRPVDILREWGLA